MVDLTLDLKSIIAIIAVITAVIIAYLANWRRNRKSLAYQIITRVSLISPPNSIRDNLQILYHGQPINNLQIFLLRIINNGKQPIDEKDFKKPLSFIFSEDAQVLSVETIEINPENLEVNFEKDGNKIALNPVLLNSNDSIEIKVIVNTNKQLVKCDARIIGVNVVKPISTFTGTKGLLFMTLPTVLILITIFTLGFLNLLTEYTYTILNILLFDLIFTVAIFFKVRDELKSIDSKTNS